MDNILRMVYSCSNVCSYDKYRTKLNKFVLENCNYTDNIQMFATSLKHVEEVAFRKISELVPGIFGFNLPKSTAYNHYDKHVDEFTESVDEEIEEKIDENGITSSGVFNYDEQFQFAKKDEKVRLTMLDTNTKYAHPHLLVDKSDFDAELISHYWHECIDDLPQKTMVTDGNTMYPQICDEFEINQSLCNFHAIFNVRYKPYKHINYNNRQINKKIESIEATEKKLVKLNNKYEPKRGRIPKKDKQRRKLHDNIKSNNKKISQ